MIDINKKYTTRDGREVRLFTTEARGKYPVVGEVDDNGVWKVHTWSSTGKHWDSVDTSIHDLIEVEPVRMFEAWVNVYRDGYFFAYNSLNAAILSRNNDTIATLHIRQEYREGDGLCDDSEKT